MAYTEQDIKRLCKGRTEEQKKVIRYFLGGGGCLKLCRMKNMRLL